MKVPKWLRRIISGIIALFMLAVWYPSIAGAGIPPHPAALTFLLCLTIIPFLLVCIFAGRNRILEIIGWVVQLLPFAYIFIAILMGIFTAMFQ